MVSSNAFVAFDALAAEFDGFVDLPLERSQREDRIDEAGWADDLFDDEGRAGLGGIESFDWFLVAAGFHADFFQCGWRAFVGGLYWNVIFIFRA